MARIRIANFSGVPWPYSDIVNATEQVIIPISETELEGAVDVSIGDDSASSVLHGAYVLGSDEVQQLAKLVQDEMPLVPAAQAVESPAIKVGLALIGQSVLGTLSTQQQLRIPTVYAPFHAGIIFRVADADTPPGVTIAFSNMTLLLPNVTYEGTFESGLMNYFELGQSAQFCFSNSILLLKSCEGFEPNKFHLWCCTMRQCNILYTQQTIEDLGYIFPADLEFVVCYASGEGEEAGHAARDTGGVRWAPITAGVTAVSLFAVLAALTAIFVRRRRTRREGLSAAQLAAELSPMADGGTSTETKSYGSQRPMHADAGRGMYSRPASTGSHAQTAGVTTTMGAVTDTVGDVYDTAVAAAETTATQRKARLMAELDHMRHHGEKFLGQFLVLSWTERREGGQGVVQFMRSTHTEEAVAVKFFLSRSAFDTELNLYQVPVLRSMMPAVRMEVGNVDGAERNGRGYPWPPCMVLEKGESLQEWKSKTQPAFSTVLDALCLVAERLAQLHGSGWVHRDLKPGNVLRLPGQHSWTLMDFGCAALAGLSVPLTFSLSYAPPEVAQAAERGACTIVADSAADMWAFGIMAIELLTGAPVFPRFTCTREAIWAQLCGREALPWEEGAPGQAGKLAQLRVLKGAILQCLQRRPEDRPTAQEVVWQWRKLFEPHSFMTEWGTR